jgi:predicted enzyme related to lactoylglutathione lyase
MANRHGDFIWYELLTTDPDAAAAFYGSVIGWEANSAGQTGMDYRQFSVGGTNVGGMMALPPGAAEKGMRPGWLGYIGVDDVDAAVDAIAAAGGAVHVPAQDIPGVGRFAMLADPQGICFYVMRGSMEGTSTSFSATDPGHCSWNELATSNQPAALTFYTTQFGWAKGDVMKMGDMGDYQFITQRGETIGAIMTRQPKGPPPAWTFYFRVADIDAAAERTRAAGGQIMHGPSEVPGGDHIVISADPQGALFALVGKRK